MHKELDQKCRFDNFANLRRDSRRSLRKPVSTELLGRDKTSIGYGDSELEKFPTDLDEEVELLDLDGSFILGAMRSCGILEKLLVYLAMASNFIPNLSDFSFSLLLVLAMAPFLAQSSELKETQLVLYFQDNVSAGPNATSLPVAVYVTDDPLTAGPEPNSASIGRGQGIAVVAALNGRNALVLLSLVFTNQEYNGSTLELQGNSKQFEQVTEVAVVSGIGKFRFARGYATLKHIWWSLPLPTPSSDATSRCNITRVSKFKD
ncbi:hypothetical protein Prudu_009864 [Prunus dulcis]|uniref:Dirigent protein n=1 Tax=Prunus dulcis TaxID=3755 RepID=A0A4Y1R759_PRUDU|nr:hypothetical protein Prudu_009864 [Prunus dulcis]